ncbi:hybrid non-ribosomal peptide synthetase/type I polyketide synthase [Streptomyces flavidovirens]|uniref:hybrid non-ribosomal peptide synthetase/type I polyketide synthase n=1 Tax=Streptomyces flavidovirens TaxID=67298 RepID=UPI0004161E5F|nr:hybrid non-ribosomal peptide synthetase/type I polyketide synthase [Streptomyces flavidovirens]
MNRATGEAVYEGPEREFTDDDPPHAVSALLRAAERSPHAGVVTIGDDGRSNTLLYPELLTMARRMLAGLRARGLSPGADIVLCGLPLPAFFPAFWACLLGGARPVAIAERAEDGSPTLERLRHTCELLGSPLVVTDRAGADALAVSAPSLRTVVAEDSLRHPPAEDHVEPEGRDVALLMLSSGSTGVPKAARLTHGGLADFAASSRRILDVRPGHTTVNWLPLDHSGAFLLYHLLEVFVGCTNVHAPTGHVLGSPLRWLDLLDEHAANHSWAPAFAYRLIADAVGECPDRTWDLSAIRSLVCGGEQIPLPVMNGFLTVVEPFGVRAEHIVPAWGMAETVTAITYGRLGGPGAVHRVRKDSLGGPLIHAGEDTPEQDALTFVAVGAPAHGAAVRVVGDRGEVLPERWIGRLQVRSTARVTPGYVRNAAADRAAFPAGPHWFDTGDLAFLAAGQVTITGRRKDLIILNGHNVYCHEVERVAASVPGARAGGIAACGIPDPDTGSESLAVFFAGTGSADADEPVARGIKAAVFARLRLTVARAVPVTEAEFPRTPAGKIRRTELRDRLLEGAFDTGDPGPGEQPGLLEAVREAVTALLGHPADSATPFYELGMTSLALTRLRDRLERRLGRAIPQTAFFEHPTVSALAAHLAAAAPEPSRLPAPACGPAPAPQPTAAGGGAAEAPDHRIAIIGMSARFPGAPSVDAFWANLHQGKDSVSVFPGRGAEPDHVPVGGVLDDIEGFDSDFFGMNPKEAGLTDPAHRLFLECCHEALEDAGYAAPASDRRIGVFAGSGMNLYDHQSAPGTTARTDGDPATGLLTAMGRQPDFLATRVAYRLGLTGPAIGVQTACSTSLVAVHLAAQSLISGDADVALAGASAVHTPQDSGYRSHPGSILSPTGRCRAFDADADGTVGGNGVAAVLLKRLDRALADGDTVHAVIAGSAVNNDGAGKAGFSAPGLAGQVEVVRRALRKAAVPPETVTYVEAHGTGTQLGDPVEFEALSRAFAEGTERTGFCTLGSVKPAIGHLDSCAGMAGLIKTVLMLKHRTLVPTLHLRRANPALPLEDSPFVLGTELKPWTAPPGVPLRAGVSALGVGGTNAHVVLEEAPPRRVPPPAHYPVLVPVSARDPEALAELVDRLRRHLRENPGAAASDVAATLALGRPHRKHRTAVVGRTAQELGRALDSAVTDGAPLGRPAFAYSGQGSARPGMAREIYAVHPGARRVLDLCEQVYAEEFGGTLLPLLLDGSTAPSDAIWPTGTAQPALFAHHMALTQLWRAAGIRPVLLLGHSVGEYAALCAAGALSVEDGLRITAWRGRLMEQQCPPGGMLTLRADTGTARRIAQASGTELAGVNGPRSQVVSGPADAVREAGRLLDQEGIPWRTVPVDRAFHSAELDAVLSELRSRAERLERHPLRLPVVSTLDGALLPAGWTVDADYLVRQAREPVRFDLATATAAREGCTDFLEVGAGDVLTRLGRHCLPDSRWVPGQGTGDGQWRGFLTSVGEFYRRGADIDWQEVCREGGRVPLPGHPMRRRRYSVAGAGAGAGVADRAPEAGALAHAGTAPAPAPATGAADEIIGGIRELTARKLGVDPTEVEPDRSFFALGADSLALMGMTTELQRLHGVRVPVRELFSDSDTPRKLAELVVRLGGGPRPAAPGAVPAAQAPGEQPPGGLPAGTSVQAPPGTTGQEPDGDKGLREVVTQQLQLAGQLVEQVTGLMNRQLEMFAGPAPRTAASAAPPPRPVRATAPEPHAATPDVPHRPATAAAPPQDTGNDRQTSGCDFSLYFFGDYPETGTRDTYALITEAAEFADRNGFHALWFPERHFNSFGAPFPNPSVLAAALASRTSRVRLHAGSVVLPLHHPVRVAEEWSVVDNISGGRVGVCFASGWHAKDFALAPENFGRHREVMYERLETVRTLWSGQPLTMAAGDGDPVEIRLHPRPVQDMPPLYVAVVGNPDSYRRAAAEDLGVVTNLMSQSVEQLAGNIALYRRTRAEHGLDPAAGRVVVLVHTYLGANARTARAEAYHPFVAYLRSSLALFDQVTNSLGFEVDLENTPEEDVDFLLGRAYESYCASRALIGDADSVAATVRGLTEAGADEIACFVDFGVPADKVLAALPAIDALRARTQQRPPAAVEPPVTSALSPAQRRIWLVEQMYPGTSMYHEPKAIRLEGPLDVPRLTWALHRTAARQPALRTFFAAVDGTPRRQTREDVEFDCPVEDHTGATEAQALRSALRTGGGAAFDLTTGPLFSCRLLRLSDERHILFLLAHHIVFDSSSTGVFAREVAAHYRSWPDGPALAPLVARPQAVVGPDRTAEVLAFWRRELDGAPDLTLPSDRPRPPVRSGAGASFTHALDARLISGLREFAAQRRVTLFMVLTAAIGAVLSRFSGQRDIVVGTAVAARPEGAEEEIGLFLDTVALRLDLTGDPGFTDLLQRVKERSTAAYEHRDVPFDELVSELNPHRDPSRNPLFQVMVEYENEAEVDFDPPALTATLLDTPSDRAPFDLSFYLTHHRDGLRFMTEYDTDLFAERDVRRLVDYVEHVLRRALADPRAPLSALTALTEADRADLALLGRQHEPLPDVEQTLHGLFEAQAHRTPDAVALFTATGHVPYGELDRRATWLARRLKSQGAGRGERVAVVLPRGPELITALLGVLKSGAAYLPVDASLPSARMEQLLADGLPVLVLTDEATAARRPALQQWRVRTMERAAGQDTPHHTADAEADGVRAGDPAYCVYTSGSTGRPKGVVVPHRGPVNLVLRHIERHPALRTLQWTSPAFDVSVQEIFTTLASGAALVLVDDELRHDPVALAGLLRRHGVQRMFMPCTPLKYLIETGPRLPALRELFSAGEALQLTPAFLRFLDTHPQCALYNQYGPTETSVIVTSHRVDPRQGTCPPIGTPVPGARVTLLDAAGDEVPRGVTGEIHVGGTAVSYGYHRRPDETAAAFLPTSTGEVFYRTGDLARWRDDGTLAYLGRTDDQVKIRGHRVEPAEVQQALTRRPGVRDAAVLPRRDSHGEWELVAYVTPAAPDRTHTARLRAELAAELPGHLVPSQWVSLDRLPVNTAGKLDRGRLPAPEDAAPGPVNADDEPATPVEKTLHELWCAELGLSGVPVTRSFFELGGHSLSAVRLLNRMTTEHGAALSMAEFFRAPTIRAVARRMDPGPEPSSDPVPAPATLRRLWRRHHERADPGVYNVAHRIDLRGGLDPRALTRALEGLVRRHGALRSRAVLRDGELLVETLADVPVGVPVDDLTALDGPALDRWCQEQAARPFAMNQAPLFRFRLGRQAEDRWVLMVVLHHAICDGWSMGIVWNDLRTLYNDGAATPLDPPAAQFADYARWEGEQLRGGRRAPLEAFWRAELGGVPLRLELPYDRPRPAELSGSGALHHQVVEGDVPGRVTEVAARLGTTPYMVFAAAFATWGARLRGSDGDVVFAASSANRAGAREHEDIVGLLGDSVLLRARLSEARTFADLVSGLGGTVFNALDHQALPLNEIVRLLAPEEADGLYPTVLFTVVTTPPPALHLRGVSASIRGVPVGNVARNELYVVLVPGAGSITMTFEYSTDLFDAATVARWAQEFTRQLAMATARPETPLSDLISTDLISTEGPSPKG